MKKRKEKKRKRKIEWDNIVVCVVKEKREEREKYFRSQHKEI